MTADTQLRPGRDRATDRYGPIFALVLCVLFFSMFVTDARWIRVPVFLAVITVFVATLSATGVTERIMRNTLIGAGGLAFLSLGSGLTDAAWARATLSFIAATALGASVLLLVRRIFEADRVEVPQVIAALTAYTQIALSFSFLYAGTAVLSERDYFNNGIAGDASDFLYFSVVTVTTLGFGDLSPATDIGRSLVILETLLGQIFLIVLVAFLVGMLGRDRPKIDPDRRARRRR